MKLFYSLLFGFLMVTAFSQESENLVKNPSFEEFEECPDRFTEEDGSKDVIPGWTTPSGTAPDYFNRCASTLVDVPNNFAGESEPVSGNAYMGAILTGTESNYREYIQGELKYPLEAGKQYCVTYWYKLASYSRLAVDQMSLYLGKEEVFDNSIKENLSLKPQVNNTPGLFLDNTDEWRQVCRVYVAAGGEKHFIIGNFKSYANTNYVVTDKNVRNLRDKSYAYYYYDDVVIRELANCNDCPCVQQDFDARFIDTTYTGGKNPITGEVKRIINDGYIRVGLIGGTEPYTVLWTNNRKGAELKNLPAGTYTFVASDKYNCKATGTVTFLEPEITKDEFDDDLRNIEEGQAIVLENIFFEHNKATLLPESFEELDRVVAFMKENSIKQIEIGGHTDNAGSESYNQKLSEDRAKSVVNYLVGKGIANSNLMAVGYGEMKPIDTNLTDEGMANNRRVEFKLLKK